MTRLIVMLRGLSAIPLIPDGDGARRLAEQELAKPEYQAAKPTPIDAVARAFAEFLARPVHRPERGRDRPVGSRS